MTPVEREEGESPSGHATGRVCDLADAFADGEVTAAEGARFRDHLPDCARCRATLHDAMQLRALAETLSEENSAKSRGRMAGPMPITSISFWRRKRVRAVAAAGVFATAAAAAWLVVARVPRHAVEEETRLALGPTRGIEARLTGHDADRWRSYEVARAAESAHHAVPLATLARLEDKGDLHGVATAFILAGEPEQAAAWLDRAGHGPDADPDLNSDRAALALGRGHKEDALALLDGVLAKNPHHPQALWNRALVLRDMGLDLTAAAAFDQVAALGEFGWSDEAKQRAKALREKTEQRGHSWNAARKEGLERIAAGGFLPLPVVREHPGLARLYFYDAVRAAPSAERVRALLPVATELDTHFGGNVLVSYVRKIAATDFTKRRPLAERYAALMAGNPADDKQFMEALRHSGETDILLGALLPPSPGAVENLAEYKKLAKATKDPWFLALAASQDAQTDIIHGELLRAEHTLLGAIAECDASKIEYRCARLEIQMALLYRTFNRVVEARQHAMAAWELARSKYDWGTEVLVLQTLAEVARYRHDFATARAFLDEAMRRQPDNCGIQQYVSVSRALMHVVDLHPAEARAEIDRAPRCRNSMQLNGEGILVDLARWDGTKEEADRVHAELETLILKLGPGARAQAHEREGRLALERDRVAGRAQLERAITEAETLPWWDSDAVIARAQGFSTLVIDAGRVGEFDRALSLLGREVGSVVAQSCVLGAAIDDERSLVVARGPTGATLGHFENARTGPEIDTAHFVPADALAALSRCARVEVYARPPLHGSPDLLPSGVAWSYRGDHRTAPARVTGLPERRIVISDVQPPSALGLPRLRDWGNDNLAGDAAPGTRIAIKGADATPKRVLAEMEDATEIVFHAHGLVDAGLSDVSLIALSPDSDGLYALTAGEVRRHRLKGAPLVILGACRAGQTAPYLHEAWSLPVAFLDAGARAVLASPAEIRDADAGPFFEGVSARIHRGEPAAEALRDERVAWLAKNPKSWVDQVMLFE